MKRALGDIAAGFAESWQFFVSLPSGWVMAWMIAVNVGAWVALCQAVLT